MRKRFKDFIEKAKKAPILITALPVHGGHAKKKEKKLKEAYGEHGPGDHGSLHDWQSDHGNHHLGNTASEVEKHLHDTETHMHNRHPSVNDYTVSSRRMNQRLLDHATGKKNRFDDDEHDDEYEKIKKKDIRERLDKHRDELDHILHKSKAEHDLHVYHGTGGSFNPDHEASKHPERKIKLPAYTSTSLDRETAAAFSHPSGENGNHQHVIHVHVKKGQSALYVGNRSAHPDEKEVLLPRNTTLKLHKHVDHVKIHGNRTLHVHHAQIVDDK